MFDKSMDIMTERFADEPARGLRVPGYTQDVCKVHQRYDYIDQGMKRAECHDCGIEFPVSARQREHDRELDNWIGKIQRTQHHELEKQD